jgi:hypothetical protein
MVARRRRHCLVMVASAAVLVGACGTNPGPVVAPRRSSPRTAVPVAGAPPLASPGVVVHLQGGAGITTVGVHGGRWSVAEAVATPDWTTIFTVDSGWLRTLDGATGAERASQPVAADLRVVVSSADGHLVALTDSPSRLGQGVVPVGRTQSVVVVAPADSAGGPMRTITVNANVLPEGFSSDHTRLFVIEFLPATHPDRYRVRGLDIATGELGPVYTYDKNVDTEEMQGLSRTQVYSASGPHGAMLYTLYSRADGGGGYDDVHALSLDGGLVHCTDLPASFRTGPGTGAIAVFPDGQRIYVATADGDVAEIDASGTSPQPFPIIHTTHINPGGTTPTVALTAENQSVWLALGTQLVNLASSDLHPITTVTIDRPVYALAAVPDGPLYAATATTLESIQPTTERLPTRPRCGSRCERSPVPGWRTSLPISLE